MMRNVKVILSVLILLAGAAANAQVKKRVLVFTRTQGYYHESVPAGIKAIQKLGAENNFAVDTSKDSTYFTDKNLKKYAALIFLSSSGRHLFTIAQQEAIKKYIHAGGGYVGIHSAACNYANLLPGDVDWPWYHQMVGATFTNHPVPQTAQFDVVDRNNIATKHLPARWEWKDEIYNFKDIQPYIHVLIKVDENTYNGGQVGASHPIAWYHEFEGGRIFYTALGHFDEAYTNPVFLQHILGGIAYAMGNKK